MKKPRQWKYPVGTRLLHNSTGRLYIVISECRKFGDGKYGYMAEDTLGSQARITLDDIILREKYCLASR